MANKLLRETVSIISYVDLQWLDRFELAHARAFLIPRLSGQAASHLRTCAAVHATLEELTESRLPSYEILEVSENHRVLRPKGRGEGTCRSLVTAAVSTARAIEIAYGDEFILRKVFIHRLTDWGFVGRSEKGYRNFSWGKLTFARDERWREGDKRVLAFGVIHSSRDSPLSGEKIRKERINNGSTEEEIN